MQKRNYMNHVVNKGCCDMQWSGKRKFNWIKLLMNVRNQLISCYHKYLRPFVRLDESCSFGCLWNRKHNSSLLWHCSYIQDDQEVFWFIMKVSFISGCDFVPYKRPQCVPEWSCSAADDSATKRSQISGSHWCWGAAVWLEASSSSQCYACVWTGCTTALVLITSV